MRGPERRLGALEGVFGRGPCEECDFDGTPTGYEISWTDPSDEDPAEPEWCWTCGRQTVVVVTWDGVPDKEALRRQRG